MEDSQAKFDYDPYQINLTEKLCGIGNLLDKLRGSRLAYHYDKSGFTTSWNALVKSRLIESVLIRLPIRPFLVDATPVDYWVIAVGSSQLSTLDEFINKESFSLTGLEYLKGVEGLRFRDLEARYQRRLQETNVVVHTIDPGTPPAVKFNIIERIKLHG